MKYTMHSAKDLVFFILFTGFETKTMQEVITICKTMYNIITHCVYSVSSALEIITNCLTELRFSNVFDCVKIGFNLIYIIYIANDH